MSEALKIAALQSQQKSMGAGILLTIFFGGFGMFYKSIAAGIICSILEIIFYCLIFVLIGFFLLPIFHIIVIVLMYQHIKDYNAKLFYTAMAQIRRTAQLKLLNPLTLSALHKSPRQ